MSDGIIYNFNQFIDDFENYKKEIESLSREGISNGLSNPNGIISSWMKYNVKDANDLKVAVSNANVPMQKLVDMIKSMQSKSGFNLMGAFDIGNISKSFDDIVGPSGSLNTVMEQMGGMVEDFKNNLKDKNIDWASKQGHDIAETFKQKFMEQNNITDETQQTMFSFMFDENMYGKTDAAFSLLAKGMKQSADQNVRDVTNKFLQDGIWSDAMIKSVEKAKNDCISRFPMFKDELQKSWGVVNFRAKIETFLDAQKLQEWQIELLKLTKGKYEVEIKTATNIDDALKSIQDGYNNAKKFIEGKKALMIRIGYRFDGKPVGTGKKQWNFGTGKWEYTGGGLDSSLQEEYLQQEELKKVGDRLAKNGYIDGVVKTGRGKPGVKGSTTDKYTEALRRNYDDLKNAIQKYKDLLKSMGSDSAMDVIKKSYGFVISSRYLTDSGLVNLANDFIRKNIKKTDTAKGFRSTLTQDRTSANVELAKLSPDARSKSILDEINISKDQYKVYDDMFSKLGSAKIASIIAFGSETKPYENIIKEMKSKFFDLAKSVKLNKSVTLEELLGIAPENLSKQPEKIQEFVNKYKDEFKNMLSPIREQFINAISKTEDADIKMVLNENLKKQIIDNIPELMKGASKDDISKYSKAIEDKFNNDNTKLKIEKIKQNMNWEDLFGDLGSLSMEQLFMLNNQLQKIVDTTKELKDPTIMKEWVSKLNNVREAMAKLEPYKNAFIAFNEVRKARNIRDDLASQIKSLPETSAYNEALSRLDYKEMERIKSTIVTINDKSMTYAEALELLIKDTKSYKKAREKAAETNPSNWIIKMLSGKSKSNILGLTEDLSNIGKIISVVDENVKSMDKFRSDVGIGENTALGKTTRSISSLSGGVNGAFSSLLKGDIFGSLDSLYNGVTGIFDVFTTDTKKEYEEDVRQHEKLASVWNDLIELKKEYLNTGYTEDINQTEDEIKNIYTLEEESAKALGKEYLNAGHSWKNHSNGVNQKKGMSEEGWDQLEKWKNKEGISDSLYNSIKGGRMTGLFDLSVEQIRKLKEDAPTFFAKLDDDTQKYLNQVEESSKSLDDSLDEIKKKWTSTTVDEMSSGYASMLESMDDMTQNFGNSITKTLRTAVINAFMQSEAMKPYIKGWYEKLNEFMENDGKLDSNEIDTLKNGSWTYYDEESGKSYTINGSKDLLDKEKTEQQVFKDLGLYSDQSASSLSGGIKNITEETADLLASYVNAIRADVSIIRSLKEISMKDDGRENNDVISEISVSVAKIENNTRKSAENTDWMKDWMTSITMVTSNGKTLRT